MEKSDKKQLTNKKLLFEWVGRGIYIISLWLSNVYKYIFEVYMYISNLGFIF